MERRKSGFQPLFY